MCRWTVRLAVTLATMWAAAATAAPSADTLQARHAELASALSASPFGRPLLVQAGDDPRQPRGEVHAVLDHGFDAVRDVLRDARRWCEVLLLQTNIQRCEPHGAGTAQQLEVAVARRYTDPVAQAQRIVFRYELQAADGQQLAVRLSADEGPLGTRHYRLQLHAVPLGVGRSFVQLSYAYEPGLLAQLATSAYLASAGRDKIGFSIVGQDAQGRPLHVRGIRGVAERNTMRYFLAIEAVLATHALPPGERLERRLRHFHAALERHPAQLHETTLQEYLALKRP